jgi:DNA-binding MarR family transcriptional regulator
MTSTSTTTTTRWLTDHEQRAWRAYQQLRHQLDARIRADLVRTAGMSDADYAVLVHLSEAADERLRARELAATLQWEKSRLSHQITRMEKRGLVERAECPTDARGAFIVLTSQGRDAIDAAAPLHVDAVRRYLIDGLTPDLLDALIAINEVAQSRLADDPTCPTEDPCDT